MAEKNNFPGREAEAAGDIETAIRSYEKELAKGYNDLRPYERLLVLYRRQKKYKEELQVLNKGIDLLQHQLINNRQKVFAKKPQRNKLLRLSKSLGQKMGLLSKNGNHLLLPPPLEKWINRKKIVQKKLKKSTSK